MSLPRCCCLLALAGNLWWACASGRPQRREEVPPGCLLDVEQSQKPSSTTYVPPAEYQACRQYYPFSPPRERRPDAGARD